MIAKGKGFAWPECKNLADLQNKLQVGLLDMEDVVEKSLHKEKYTKQEVCEILGVTPDELAQSSLSQNTLHGNYCFTLYCCGLLFLHTILSKTLVLICQVIFNNH